MSISSLNPQLADQLVYTARSLVTYDRLQIIAPNELKAKIELIDKLGYVVRTSDINGRFVLADADDDSIIETTLNSTTFEAAVNEVLEGTKWVIGEPQEMLGGSMGRGFGTEGL